MAITELQLPTNHRDEMIDITARVREAVAESSVKDGFCRVFVPHTTAAVTINESADPAVTRDIIMELDAVIPWQDDYHHAEGNSAAHIKTALVGSSEMLLVKDGNLVLGTWQAIYFCEFDGPRTRKVLVSCSEG
jgi:secondary thiamine-phosphate synthase enzyme